MVEQAVIKEHCDGHDLRMMLASATRLLERNYQAVNALNVFPVPDGDTGINMLLTMKDTLKKIEESPSGSASETANAMAKGALLGARGNSGVILSQFLRGLAEGLQGRERFNGQDLALALQEATKWAYKSVGQPVEGTILTVIREAAEAASQSCEGEGTLVEVCEAARDACKRAVANSPTLLAVLREAGVVDAGGQGLCFIVEGFLSYLKGEDIDSLHLNVEEPLGVDAPFSSTVSREFLEMTEDEIYGYCTQFAILGEGLDPDSFREKVSSMARSTVVIGDEKMIKIHAHTEDPGMLLTFGVSHGTLAQIKIDNMDEQHQGYMAERREETRVEQLSIALVAMASGKGLEELFAGNGASAVVRGGDTMNPSTQEMLLAIEGVPSQNVIVLPNNRNVVLSAKQAAELSGKSVKVVPTESIPQGIGALLAFNVEDGLEQNVARMEKTRESIRTGEVTTAIRSATMDGRPVREGQVIGLLDRKLVTLGDFPQQVLIELLANANLSGGDLVTVFWGDGMDEDGGQEVLSSIARKFPDVEAEVVYGGQPYYHYIVSLE